MMEKTRLNSVCPWRIKITRVFLNSGRAEEKSCSSDWDGSTDREAAYPRTNALAVVPPAPHVVNIQPRPGARYVSTAAGRGREMGDFQQYFDIILFAMVAGFLVLRLRSVLGRRTGNERRRELFVRRTRPATEKGPALIEPSPSAAAAATAAPPADAGATTGSAVDGMSENSPGQNSAFCRIRGCRPRSRVVNARQNSHPLP